MMQKVLLKELARRVATLSVVALLSLGFAACSDSNFIPDENAEAEDPRGENRRFNTLNELVIADCNDKPENTRPVAVNGLAFNNATPENTRPEDSLEGQTCI